MYGRKRLVLNRNRNHVEKLMKIMDRNGGHCPCTVADREHTLCPCDHFIVNNECHCNLFIKQEED